MTYFFSNVENIYIKRKKEMKTIFINVYANKQINGKTNGRKRLLLSSNKTYTVNEYIYTERDVI